MKNRIEKANKTKFDYVCRGLGVFGFILIVATVVIGGSTLNTISNENKTLTNLINIQEETTNKTQNAKNNEEIVNSNIEIIIE